MSTWTELPQGQTITFKKGNFYAAIASVAASHTKASIIEQAGKRGLQIFDYAEQGERAGLGPDPKSPEYRYISIQAQATQDGSLPWSPGFPASLVAHYDVVKAWEAPPATPGQQPTPTPTPAASIEIGAPLAAVVLGLAVAGGFAWWLWARPVGSGPIVVT